MLIVPTLRYCQQFQRRLTPEESFDKTMEHSRLFRVFCLQFFLLFYFISTVLWMYDTEEMRYKFFEIVLMLIYLYFTYLICRTPCATTFVKIIWKYFFIVSLGIVIFSIPALLRGDLDSERVSVLGGGTNVFVRFVAICVIQIVDLISRRFRISYVFFLPFLFTALMTSGSRGGMVSLVIALFVFMLFRQLLSFRMIFKTVAVFCVFIAAIVVVFAMFPTLSKNFYSAYERRIERKTFESSQASSGRDEIYSTAWNKSWEKPFFGHGIGGWVYDDLTDLAYPHNHLLELFYEGGLVAVLLFLILLFMVYRRTLFLHRHRQLYVPVATCLVFIFFAVQFSSDFFGTRYMYSMMLMAGLANRETAYMDTPKKPLKHRHLTFIRYWTGNE